MVCLRFETVSFLKGKNYLPLWAFLIFPFQSRTLFYKRFGVRESKQKVTRVVFFCKKNEESTRCIQSSLNFVPCFIFAMRFYCSE